MDSVLIKTTPEYEFYSDGRIWSNYKKDFLKLKLDKDGYLMVTLYVKGKRKDYFVHRLMAETFILNPYNLPQVNHINEVKTDNSVRNLEWCDCKYNINYGTGLERRAFSQRNNYRSKQVEMCDLNWKHEAYFPSLGEAARQTGIPKQSVWKCCTGSQYTVEINGVKHRFRFANPNSIK